MSETSEDRTITEHERKHLLAALHRRLIWVGREIPYNIELNGKKYNPHTVVWELLNKKKLDNKDREFIDRCILHISEKAKEDELELATGQLTEEEAKKLFDETAGLLRTLMDLRDIEEGVSKEKEKEFFETFNRERVAEARRWISFLKETGEIK
ncbi:DUF5788 family protein [Methanolobus chelungpuianus]|uniref:Methyl-accepting chemotaxis protein n=1 Tax=Methanolobus chelungpuianus TaxID=502115 RepID=A0AAE3HAR0_9EURY|nr:DUF5788 family protein [Methanolobus chelungpuianus]MCQ6962830.1 methyl-accepting chemotaxis protein [Methanolobus chelungpuianus]